MTADEQVATDISELGLPPYVVVQDYDKEIVSLLGQIRDALGNGTSVDQLAFAACGYLAHQARILKGELKRHENMLAAVAEGQNAASSGLPISANPYVPDEPDCRWTYWNTGWAAG